MNVDLRGLLTAVALTVALVAGFVGLVAAGRDGMCRLHPRELAYCDNYVHRAATP